MLNDGKDVCLGTGIERSGRLVQVSVRVVKRVPIFVVDKLAALVIVTLDRPDRAIPRRVRSAGWSVRGTPKPGLTLPSSLSFQSGPSSRSRCLCRCLSSNHIRWRVRSRVSPVRRFPRVRTASTYPTQIFFETFALETQVSTISLATYRSPSRKRLILTPRGSRSRGEVRCEGTVKIASNIQFCSFTLCLADPARPSLLRGPEQCRVA